MFMVLELVIGVLACVCIGVIYFVVFVGFLVQVLVDCIKDVICKVVICLDYNSCGIKNILVKKVVDDVLAMDCDSIEMVLVYKNIGGELNMVSGCDKWWYDEVDG